MIEAPFTKIPERVFRDMGRSLPLQHVERHSWVGAVLRIVVGIVLMLMAQLIRSSPIMLDVQGMDIAVGVLFIMAVVIIIWGVHLLVHYKRITVDSEKVYCSVRTLSGKKEWIQRVAAYKEVRMQRLQAGGRGIKPHQHYYEIWLSHSLDSRYDVLLYGAWIFAKDLKPSPREIAEDIAGLLHVPCTHRP